MFSLHSILLLSCLAAPSLIQAAPTARVVTKGQNETIVTLTAQAILPKGAPFYALGERAIQSLSQDYNLNDQEIRSLQQEAAAYFRKQFNLNINPSPTSSLSGKQLQGNAKTWLFSSFVFIPELNYRIVSHPNPSCLQTNVTAAGFLITNMVPTHVEGFGILPALTTIIYGRYLWHGSQDGSSSSSSCPRVIVPAISALPIVMNSLGYRPEEYFTSHPEFGSGFSHVTAIDDKPKGRFEIWTTMQFEKGALDQTTSWK